MRHARSFRACSFPLALLILGAAVQVAPAQEKPAPNPSPDARLSASEGPATDECQDKLSLSYEVIIPDSVDLSAYLDQVLAKVRRSACARMPESVRHGDQGKVVLDLFIQRDGSLALLELLEPPEGATPAHKPLESSALAAVRTSAPFEPLPDAFSRRYLELHFVFGYNVPVVLSKPVPEAPTPAIELPSVTPGQALEDSIHGAPGRGPTPSTSFGGAMPRGGGGGLSGDGGGAGEGYLGGGVQMLTPDQGVDFSGYLKRVVDKVRKEWYAIMPQSAQMGDRGRVVIDFKIMRDGSVPLPEPILRSTSTKDPLDRAALSAIRGSSPFEPLPSAFSGPYIELRFIFFYNYKREEIK